MRTKGRHKIPPAYCGTKNVASLFNATEVREIRSLAKVLQQKSIAASLGVSRETISRIVHKVSYKDVL
jgi:DNA-binding transcriptional regulator LsrR (DeoR family)